MTSLNTFWLVSHLLEPLLQGCVCCICRKTWILNNVLTLSFFQVEKSAKTAHEMLKSVYGDNVVISKIIYK